MNQSSRTAILMTGFPGFIGTRLAKKLLESEPAAFLYLLVEERFERKARQTLQEFQPTLPSVQDRTQILIGDITQSDLGLSPDQVETLRTNVDHLFHLAAIYDLAVKKEVAYRVNVVGTRNVLDWAEHMHHLQSLIYFSTCVVSGDRTGKVNEDELDEGQSFHNHYEWSKFEAEKEVRRRLGRLPIIIIRPATIIGDSKTGQTEKYDGPYFFFAFLNRLPRGIPVLHWGTGAAPVHLVPVDFIVAATVEIFRRRQQAIGQTFQLTDPQPLSGKQLMELACEKLGRRPPVGSIPRWLAKLLLQLPLASRLTGIIPQVCDYIDHNVEYDSTHTQEILKTSEIRCPPLVSYFDHIIQFVREHPRL